LVVGKRRRRTRVSRFLIGICGVRACGRRELGVIRIENSEIEHVAGELD
jgi:hypothetical protein